jgi:hypothetical protein
MAIFLSGNASGNMRQISVVESRSYSSAVEAAQLPRQKQLFGLDEAQIAFANWFFDVYCSLQGELLAGLLDCKEQFICEHTQVRFTFIEVWFESYHAWPPN